MPGPQHWAETGLSVGANSVSTNRLAGTLVSLSQRGMLARLAAVASAAGITCLFQVGATTVLNNGALSNANRFPNEKDDVIARARMGRDGSIMNLQFTNTTAGALTINYFLDFL